MSSDATKESELLSQRGKELLDKEEGTDVDFKRQRGGLKSEDIVAFANSPNGGVILLGVDETEDENGKQKGKVVGCKISDGEKLAIISKAMSCRPPVDIEIFIETTEEGLSFYRIEIPSGQYKPYCTEKGLYMIRGDGRNLPLTPDKLLDLYLDVQGSKFFERFRQATADLEKQIKQSHKELKVVNKGLYQMKEKISSDLSDLLVVLESKVEETTNRIQHEFVEKLSDDTIAFSMKTFKEIQAISKQLKQIEAKVAGNAAIVNSLFAHFNVEYPRIAQNRTTVKELAMNLYLIYQDREIVMETLKKIFPYGLEMIEIWVNEVLDPLESSSA
ncbi:RNA-binding domain-containing protein [Thermoflavimicrobium daqui]|uniref:RNA-binding domain-containing protein n=1 Tax=Thermoflavimicrobium daqui TaxID=2137476 RepID=UPI00143D1DE9|nr:RNA-binding domain-containing protein [Thermoflavimicrobium daqui]